MKQLIAVAFTIIATIGIATADDVRETYLSCSDQETPILMRVRNKKVAYFELEFVRVERDKKNHIDFPIWRKTKQIPSNLVREENSVWYYRDQECHVQESE